MLYEVITGSNNQPAGTYGKFYIDGNITTASDQVSQNNWLGVNLHSTFSTYAPGVTKDDIKSETEYETGEVTTHTASQAFEKVVQHAGASLAQDSVDMRITHETETGTRITSYNVCYTKLLRRMLPVRRLPRVCMRLKSGFRALVLDVSPLYALFSRPVSVFP